MIPRFKIFRSISKSWEDLCDDVTEFLTTVPKENVISVNTFAVGGADLLGSGAEGFIIVWYYEGYRNK